MLSFLDLGVAEPIRRALLASGYEHPTPIQQQTIPLLLEGRDVLGVAQTGTGKTAAFTLPILQHLAAPGRSRGRGPAALILTPTRELAAQIAQAIKTYARHLKLRETVVYGGVGQGSQVKALQAGVDILVATPGRLLDLIGQGHARMDRVSHLVLDEADRMLDMGFIGDVRRILATLPTERQSMLFSATMPEEIARLAASMLRNPERVEVAPAGTAIELVDQCVFHVTTADKRRLLGSLLQDAAMSRVIVFTRTKHGANRVTDQLVTSGVAAAAIHGNKSQTARQAALEDFRSGRSRVLVATDIAARGIDVRAVSHIINYDVPNTPETYVHRIGRTARAGASGAAFLFCDATERSYLRDIERLIRRKITVADTPRLPAYVPVPAAPATPAVAAAVIPISTAATAGRKRPARARSGSRRRRAAA